MQPQVTLKAVPDVIDFDIHKALQKISKNADWVGIRYVSETTQTRGFRNELPENQNLVFDRGAMIEILLNGHFAYAATSDLSLSGIEKACQRAVEIAKASAPYKIFSFGLEHRPKAVGRYESPVLRDLTSERLADFSETLRLATKALKVSDAVVMAGAEVTFVETHFRYVSTNGSDIDQRFLMASNHFEAVAKKGNETQKRSDNGPRGRCVQAGLEEFERTKVLQRCIQIGKEALELLDAPNCPSGKMDLLLAPDQMLLQIHESIGHPLEYDRILGDERNYAGWSFVKPGDFGNLQYGSKLMNITFDPTVSGEFASYAFDDCGNPATREFLIREGKLLRGLGSLESQARLKLAGVANFRASSWNRAPIDRMANINLEPGNTAFSDMVAQVENGVYMQSNTSWSIDDYRNKFQFGCEYARLIKDGKLGSVVKNPNYRGITVPFWNALKAVGKKDEMGIFGSPFCGKGEPNQVIRVGHASPPCLFSGIDVFGGVE